MCVLVPGRRTYPLLTALVTAMIEKTVSIHYLVLVMSLKTFITKVESRVGVASEHIVAHISCMVDLHKYYIYMLYILYKHTSDILTNVSSNVHHRTS